MQRRVSSLVIMLLFGIISCASIGLGTVARGRFDYISAISDSWKAQMLLNLVKLRYGDARGPTEAGAAAMKTGIVEWWNDGGAVSVSVVSSLGALCRCGVCRARIGVVAILWQLCAPTISLYKVNNAMG